jgi:hypothetical protein
MLIIDQSHAKLKMHMICRYQGAAENASHGINGCCHGLAYNPESGVIDKGADINIVDPALCLPESGAPFAGYVSSQRCIARLNSERGDP